MGNHADRRQDVTTGLLGTSAYSPPAAGAANACSSDHQRTRL